MYHKQLRLILLATALSLGLMIFQSQNPIQASGPTCNHTIGSNVSTADGQGNYANVRPGDTVCLPAGTRNTLTLKNFKGTADRPVTFINSGGKVKVDGNQDWVGIQIINSEHIKLTGTGDSTIKYGIEVFNTTNTGLYPRLQTRYFEIDHIEIHDGHAGIRTNTKTTEAPSGWIQYNTNIHDCYFHDLSVEALYIGRKAGSDGTPLEGLTVYNNRIERAGWDGIQVRNGRKNIKIYNNYLHTIGFRAETQAGAGLNIGPDVVAGDWYNNVVINARIGVQSYKADNFNLYNNTIVKSQNQGILVAGDNGARNARIYNNLIADSGSAHLSTKNATVQNNLTFDTIETTKFSNPNADDYHLQSGSRAIDAGLASSFASIDFDGVSRPQGAGPDVGAYEFTGSSPAPTPIPSATLTPTPVPSPSPTSTPPPSGSDIILSPVADTFVHADKPGDNFGNYKALRSIKSPNKIIYLKFDLSSLASANISAAYLRLFAVDGTSVTQNIKLVGNDWTEREITFQNRPSPTTLLTSANNINTDSWMQVDLTSTIQQYAGQTLSLAIESTGSNELKLNSKEADTNQPQLLVTTGGTQVSTAAEMTAYDPAPATALVINHPASVALGETFKVSVEAQNIPGDGLYGFQLELNYDPALISVSNLQVNPDLSFVVLNNVDNAAGKVRVAASRQGRVPGLAGSVSLLTFDATAANTAGPAAFTFENEKVSDPQAQAIDIAAQDGTILIGAEPEPTDEPAPEPTDEPAPEPTDEPAPEPTDEPAPEPTDEPAPEPTDEPAPEPTDEPAPEPTDEPAPEPTDEPATAVLFGQVILAGRAGNDWSGANIILTDSGQAITTDATGNYSIAGVAAGAHTSITADAPGYLPAVCNSLTVAAPETALQTATLLSGDISDDNTVDITDATAVGASFGLTGPEIAADLTRDSIVDIFDIVLVSLNFGQTGPQEWVCQ